ncbi:MAG: sodium ion-translocating decarboxylase subunit beta [Treponema sp.]|nr:sodium ion-translocating decarboxylase subunit beta [Treponema sp.]
MNSKVQYSKKIFLIMLVMLFAAGVVSFGTKALASDGSAAAAPTSEGLERVIVGTEDWHGSKDISVTQFIRNIGKSTGIYKMIHQETAEERAESQRKALEAEAKKKAGEAELANSPAKPGWQYVIMIAVGFLIVYLAVAKGFEPLLLIPIGFGTILVNIPGAGMGNLPDGMLAIIYKAGVGNEFFPMLIFMGIGAMTDFGPLIANPKTAILGGAAQFGVFFTLFGVAVMDIFGLNYNIMQACAIAIIGGADGPTSIYVSGKLAPELMAVIAVAAYSYMALVPMIQPPIMKLLTTKKERMIHMDQLRPVSKTERVLFPLMLLILTILLLPPAAPLIGMLAFGNFVHEAGCVQRLSKTMENELMNIVSILLSLGVGSQMTPENIIRPESAGIILLGLVAFAVATAGGLCMAKIMNLFLPKGKKINPFIGSAGVSAVPMAARVANKVGQEFDPSNFLLMNAMGPNVSGVIGTAIAAGVFIATYGL